MDAFDLAPLVAEYWLLLLPLNIPTHQPGKAWAESNHQSNLSMRNLRL